MAQSLLLLISLLMAGPSWSLTTAVMEGTPASNNALLVDTPTARVGIGTSSPKTNLDVSGDAQFGAGAAKSTFTATPGDGTYALQLSSGVDIANGGPIRLSSGSYIRFPDGSIGTTAITGGGGGGGSSIVVTSQSVSGVGSVSFPIIADTPYCMHGGLFSLQNGQAIGVRFNGNSGANYNPVIYGLKLDGTQVLNTITAHDAIRMIESNTEAIAVNGYLSFSFCFRTQKNDNTMAGAWGQTISRGLNNVVNAENFGGNYGGTGAAITDVSVESETGGTFDGDFTLEKITP